MSLCYTLTATLCFFNIHFNYPPVCVQVSEVVSYPHAYKLDIPRRISVCRQEGLILCRMQ